MRLPQELDELRTQAVELRRQGKSRREIKQILGPMSNTTLNEALAGEPPPDWTRRPNAKDELRARARDLRTRGMSYDEIAQALGVAKSSVSLWVRDLPTPARLSYAERRKRAAEGVRRYWEAERPAREAHRTAAWSAAAAQIGELTDREILRLYIHENADVAAAERFWLTFTGAPPEQFLKTTLKHHQPKTVHKNVGENYHGCLRIDARRSRGLYRDIEGWVEAITSDA